MQVIDKPTREDVLLDLLLTNKQELDEDLKAEGSLFLVQGSERREQDQQQNYNPGSESSRFWAVQGSALQVSMRNCLEG